MLAKGMHELLCSREVVAKEITKVPASSSPLFIPFPTRTLTLTITPASFDPQVESELNGLRTDLERLKQRRESLFDQMAGKTPAKVEGSIGKRENNLAFLKVPSLSHAVTYYHCLTYWHVLSWSPTVVTYCHVLSRT